LTFDEAAKAVLDDYIVNNKRSLRVVALRINRHLLPFFGGKRMTGITTATVNAYVAHRLAQGIRNRHGERIKDVSNAEINRELTLLKRCFSLAMQSGRIAMRPHIGMLQESAPRSGFLERDQIASVVAHLSPALQPVVEFAYITGWRTASEVLPLEWRNVDFKAGEVKIDAGASKNGEPRVFPMTADLRALLEERQREHERLKQAGHIIPQVFFRLVAQGRGGELRPKRILEFGKAWDTACAAAGVPAASSMTCAARPCGTSCALGSRSAWP
jgi:integrase